MPRPEATPVCEQTKIYKHGGNLPIEIVENPPEEQDNKEEKRRRQTMAFRKLLAAKRADPNEPQQRHIRFDYSDIRLENENLDLELEIRESNLHREKFLKTVDREQNFKKAKKDADAMLQLKNAVNRRKPNTSFEKVVQSACIRKESRVTVPKEKATQQSASTAKLDLKDNAVDTNEDQRHDTDTDSDTSSEPEEPQDSKPFNNLTMFLLSLHTYKSAGYRNRGDTAVEAKDVKDDSDKLASRQHDELSSRPQSYVPRTKSAVPRTRSAMPGSRSAKTAPRSALPRARSALQAEVCEKYGIHVQKDHSRSRRTLGEISKLEHDTKFKHVDKFEERRKKLLAACRDTGTLDRRINTFLKDVDEFKRLSRPDNSLERILMRSKSAYVLRSPPTEFSSINMI